MSVFCQFLSMTVSSSTCNVSCAGVHIGPNMYLSCIWTAALRKGRMQIIFDAFDHQDVTDYIRLRMFNSTDPFRKVPVAGDTLAQQRRQQRDFQLTSRELASTKTIKHSAPVSILLDAEGSLETLKSRVNVLRSGEDGGEGVGALMQRPALRFEAIEACGHPLLEVAAQIREVRAQLV